MSASPSTWVDRRTGRLRADPVYREGLLTWLHGSEGGWLLTRWILSRSFVSRSHGWLNRRRWSARKIAGFVRTMNVDMEESLRAEGEFRSFNDFITRRIDLSRRPIHPDPAVCVAPADGRVRAFPVVGRDTRFTLKRTGFDLRTLLRDEELAARYAGGSMVVSRLYLADYHHFHFPAEGTPGEPRIVRGRCYATTPYTPRRTVPFLAENHRQLTILDSPRFRRIALVEVGAFTIASIRQRFRPDRPVRRGEHKGYFELGGSVVVLLFERGAIRLDEDLCENTRAGLETYVRLGESLGRAVS